jgi:hypothetical protein
MVVVQVVAAVVGTAVLLVSWIALMAQANVAPSQVQLELILFLAV